MTERSQSTKDSPTVLVLENKMSETKELKSEVKISKSLIDSNGSISTLDVTIENQLEHVWIVKILGTRKQYLIIIF